MESARLWTMPEVAPPVLVATAGPINAKKTGKFADGIITVGAPLEKIGGLFAKFEEGAREAGKDPDTMPKVLQLHLSWAADRRGGPDQRDGGVAQRRDEVPQGGHPLPVRVRADGQARAARGLRGPDGDHAPTRTSTGPRSSASSTSASTGSTCTTSAATRPSGSRSSAARSCPSCTAELGGAG